MFAVVFLDTSCQPLHRTTVMLFTDHVPCSASSLESSSASRALHFRLSETTPQTNPPATVTMRPTRPTGKYAAVRHCRAVANGPVGPAMAGPIIEPALFFFFFLNFLFVFWPE